MLDRKLDFKTWCNNIGIRECDQTTKCDDCKSAWDFAEVQEKREYELLESEHSELLANFCKVDMERIKLSREVEELQKKIEELEKITHEQSLVIKAYKLQFKSQMEANESRREENEALKKKLGEAVEVIDSLISVLEECPEREEARAFLRGDKDE